MFQASRLSRMTALLAMTLVIASMRQCVADDPPLSCDIDLDGDCDNYDGLLLLNEFGGSNASADLDENGLVDIFDFLVLKIGFGSSSVVGTTPAETGRSHSGPFGIATFTPGMAQLTYDAVTGNVTLDQSGAPGGVINGLVLALNSETFLQAGLDELQLPLLGLVVKETYEISETAIANQGFVSNPADLGPILPPELTLSELESLFAANGTQGAYYVGDISDANIGARIHTFQLAIVGSMTAGDFDNDTDVDGVDFLLWQRGESPTPLSAIDLTDWEVNYGSLVPISTASRTVPEPSTWIALLVTVAVTVSSSHRLNGLMTIPILS